MTFRDYLILQAFGAAAFNAAMNAGCTWFLWGGEPQLPLGTIAADLAMTPIWIGLLSVLLGTAFTRRAFANGTMLRDSAITPPAFLQWLPRTILSRSLVVAALCAVSFALPLSLLLPLMGDGMLTPAGAIGTKVILTVGFSVLIVPLVIFATTTDIGRPATGHVG